MQLESPSSAISGCYGCAAISSIPCEILPSGLYRNQYFHTYILLVIPFFLLAGNLWIRVDYHEDSFLFKFGEWTGGLGFRRGLGIANIFASIIFAGWAVRAVADVAGGLETIEPPWRMLIWHTIFSACYSVCHPRWSQDNNTRQRSSDYAWRYGRHVRRSQCCWLQESYSGILLMGISMTILVVYCTQRNYPRNTADIDAPGLF